MLQALDNADFFLVSVAELVDFFAKVKVEEFGKLYHAVFNFAFGLVIKARAVVQQIFDAHVVMIETLRSGGSRYLGESLGRASARRYQISLAATGRLDQPQQRTDNLSAILDQ